VETPGTSGPLGKAAANNAGSIVLNGGYLQYSASNQNDYSGRFSTAASQQYNVDTNGQNVTWAAPLISAGGSLTKVGAGILTLTGSSTYSGATTVNAGTLAVGVANALPIGGNLNIGSGASVVANSLGAAVAVQVGSLNVAGQLDLNNNDLIVHNGTLAAVNTLVASGYNNGAWNGATGIVSSTAASDTAHLTALGVIVNDNGSATPLYGADGGIASTFGGNTPVDGDILVKYTYYGDANLDGHVDGSDYSLIDNGALNQLTGWHNGDFNYDGVTNGSDYTLIDNAFNTQGAQISSEIATITAQIAGSNAGTSAVPEPTTLGLLGIGAVGLLGRRSRRHRN
jgi:autotransporter-associated beta strand protein